VASPRLLLLPLLVLLAASCSTQERTTVREDTAPSAEQSGSGTPWLPPGATPYTGTPGASTPAATPSPSARRRTATAPRYVFPVQGCRVVSPVTGVIDEVSTVDRWSSRTNRGADRGGISFSVVGVDGVRYYGSHLAKVLVRPGQHVVAGQQVGTVGSTGSARGIAPHLHLGISWPTRHGIWWVRRGEVYPWPYLDSWRAGGNRSPAPAVEAKHARLGDEPRCSTYC
jgi:murein DD-endopeptidase MepM/ murein hydrolase activator NlpD